MIANNSTAQAYDNLQKSIDWSIADNDSQLNVLTIMKQLLIQAPSHTAIFDNNHYDLRSGRKVYESALDRLDIINNRISRLSNT